MRHRLKDRKLGRTKAHRKALMAHLVCALIEQKRIRTTLPKAKEARSAAEAMVTVAKGGAAAGIERLVARRTAISFLRDEKAVKMLFDKVLPACQNRTGGYTRITKLGRRYSDGSEMAVLEWVDVRPAEKKADKAKAKEAGEENKK